MTRYGLSDASPSTTLLASSNAYWRVLTGAITWPVVDQFGPGGHKALSVDHKR